MFRACWEKSHFRQRTSEEMASAISELRSKGNTDTSDDPFAADGAGVAAVDSWQSFSVWHDRLCVLWLTQM
jgi:hypothetical protein